MLLLILSLLFILVSSNYPVVKLDPSNMIVLRGEINGKNSARVINELVSLKSKEIYLYIDSPGGSVFDGLQIIQAMESLQESGTKVYTIANNVASMAYIIHQCGTERYIRPWSTLMQHQMSYGNEGQYYNVKSHEELVEKLYQKLLEKQAKIARLTKDQFDNLTRHDMWLIGEEAVKRGFGDKIVSVMCDFKPEITEEKINLFFAEIKLTFSTCPLVSKPLSVEVYGNLKNEEYEMINRMYNTELSLIYSK